ncbi:diguanylate cyclase [Glaciimonas sp. PCH181]|uniref:GGDEF domain-containing protein n=1 Tax=Glaciimonas sp. PCH181 TaxID=2133943 RepID=UPI000D37A0A2|nr:sensor domain-containing diguanylate cyclase [Glaciimonas sp. PCH181]PUA16494.1 GGDEF domain-containing protein [Glaciimonas sp. PCH181]
MRPDDLQYPEIAALGPQADTNRAQILVGFITRAYSMLLLVLFGLLPLSLIIYVQAFQDPLLLFEDHSFHKFAIGIATLEGAFVSYVTWRCYQYSGEPFLRWLTLGFLGFTLTYLPHGLFTGMAHHHIWLFLLYGPASRILMATFFFAGLLSYGQPAELIDRRASARYWWNWVGIFILMDVVIALIALSPLGSHPWVRLSMEIGALGISLLGAILVFARRIHSPLMTIFFTLSLVYFAQSSLAFVLAKPWNHEWWLAHGIFAGGFLVLSYGVVTAFFTTRAFSTVLRQEELVNQLRTTNARAENALMELRDAHQALAHQAATDPLTGAANRREFLSRIEIEIARSIRTGDPLSFLALDLDHFKHTNDRFGHQAGDTILTMLVVQMKIILRPSDMIGRFGGDEFIIALPSTTRDEAIIIGERCRSQFEDNVKIVQEPGAKVSMCIGVAEFGRDGNTLEACLKVADERLYRAKVEGRNRVIAC